MNLRHRSRLLLIGVLLLLPVGIAACTALVPGYAEEKARLKAELDAAVAAREAAVDDLRAARDAVQADGTGMAEVAAALETLTARLQEQINATTALAKHEVDSAGQAAGAAGSGVAGLVGGGLGAVATVLAAFAQARANAAKTAADHVAHGPSRARPELDDLWDQNAKLRAELAEVRGRMASAPTTAAAAA